MINFFVGFKIEGIEEMISFASYLSLVMNTVVSFGLIFEMPSIMMILTRFGILKVSFLKNKSEVYDFDHFHCSGSINTT